jgi:2-keto-myo-inositol isomerase
MDALVFFAFRGVEYPQVKARLLEMCKMASAIQCPTIVVVASPLPDRKIGWDAVAAEYTAVLRDLAAIAEPYGIKLAFEFLGFGCPSVRTPRGAYEILLKVDRANVGMSFDAAHFYGGGGLLSELDDVDPVKIFAFHLDDLDDAPKEAFSDRVRNLPGKGILPLDAICQKLRSIGYNGPCSVELFRPEFWQQDPLEVARQTRKAALQVLTPYFSID